MPNPQPTEFKIEAGDARIYGKVFGPEGAPVLVLLHGNGEDLHLFDPHIAYFSQHYRTIAIDTRGHGLSTRGTAPFHFYTFATDLVAVLDALHINKAHVVGFSDGAITALHAALIAPERLLSMVLLGANYHTRGVYLIFRLQIVLIYIWLWMASLFWAEKRKQREIWGLMVHQPKLTLAQLSRITLPTLVVTGQNDMVKQRHNDEIHRAISGSKRIIVPDGNHFWFFTKPELFNQWVMEFLSCC